MLGRAMQGTGNHEEALDCFRKAEACYAGNTERQPPISIRLAKLLWQQGEHDQARTMLRLLKIQHPHDTQLAALQDEWGETAS
jgi:tetratricopeptide (TPR) repeat protein